MLDRRSFFAMAGRGALAALGLEVSSGSTAGRLGDPARRAISAGHGATSSASWISDSVPESPSRGSEVHRIGLQLYTVRREMGTDVERTLARVAGIGYDEVEFAGYFDRTPRSLRSALQTVGLESPAAHVDFDLLDADSWPAALETAAEIGHRWVVVPWIPEDARVTLDGYRRIADLFNWAGEKARDHGLRFAFHNHDVELAPIDGRIPLDLLLEETDADFVDFEMDVFWVVRGRGDPLTYFERFPGRFPLAHFKDMDASDRMADVGAGRIDFAALLAAGEIAGLEHHFVEHDAPDDPMASARASHAHLDEILRRSRSDTTHFEPTRSRPTTSGPVTFRPTRSPDRRLPSPS